MQTDYADERHGLAFLLQNEYPHIVQPQFGGQHRASRPAPGNDHVEHEGRAISAGGRRPGTSPTVKSRSTVSFDDGSAVNCGESIGVAFRECLVVEALPATPTSIARP